MHGRFPFLLFRAELVVDCQLPHAPGIHECYLREIDERQPPRSKAISQRILECPPVSDVEFPGERDQYGRIIALCRFEYRRVVLDYAISVSHEAHQRWPSTLLH